MRSFSPPPPARRPVLARWPTVPGPGHLARVPLGTPTQLSLLIRSPRAQSVLTRTSSRETPGTTQQSWAWQSRWARRSSSSTSLHLPHFTTSETSGTKCGDTGCLLSGEDLPTTWPTARRRRSCLCKWSTPSTTPTMTWSRSGPMTSYDPPAHPITRWRFAVPLTTSRWWLPTPSPWSPVPSPVCSLSMPSTPFPPPATTTPFHTPTPPPGYSRDWPPALCHLKTWKGPWTQDLHPVVTFSWLFKNSSDSSIQRSGNSFRWSGGAAQLHSGR